MQFMKTLTIFTPTFNRGYILPQLYDSLCRQDCQDFEWLIVDDGSTDNTAELVSKWIDDNKISIRYYSQENGGKMRAHNRAVILCATPLFLCVDSDDYLSDNGISSVLGFWSKNYKGEQDIAGLVANRLMIKEGVTGGCETVKLPQIDRCSMHDLGSKYGHYGETSPVFKTEILLQFPFPEFKNENFVTESVIYDRIDFAGYKLLLSQEPFVLCRYLEDGYTRNSAVLYKKAPLGWALYFNQQIKFWRKDLTQKERLRNVLYYFLMTRIAGVNIYESYKKSTDKSFRFLLASLISPYYMWRLNKLF